MRTGEQGAASDYPALVDAMVGKLESGNYYDVLGVSRTASSEEIEVAFELLDYQFDPQGEAAREHGSNIAELMAVSAMLQEAYAVLADAQARGDYDIHLELDPTGVSYTIGATADPEASDAKFLAHLDIMLLRLGSANYYELLGVESDATTDLIGAQWKTLREQFDPVAAQGRCPATRFAQLHALIFMLKAAHDILADTGTRRAYDNSLRVDPAGLSVPPDPMPAQPVDPAPVAAESAVAEPEGAAPARSAPVKSGPIKIPLPEPLPPEPAAAEPSADSGNASREARKRSALGRLARDLKARPKRPPVTEIRPAGKRGQTERNEVVADLRRTLTASRTVSAPTAAAGRQNIDADPTPMDPQEVLAEQVWKDGQWSAAAQAWSQVSDRQPDNIMPARRAALAFLKANKDLKRGVLYARRAATLGPQDAFNHRVAGQMYAATGMLENARKSLRLAIKLNADDPVVRTLLDRLEA